MDDFTSYNHSTIKSTDIFGNPYSIINSENKIKEPCHYGALGLGYLYKIDSLAKKISSDVNYTSYRNFSNGLMTAENLSSNGDFISNYLQKSNQPGSVKIFSVKADADLPFRNFSLKTGLKYAEVENDNQFRFDSLQAGNFIEIEDISNHFKYKERIAAAYISGFKIIGKTAIEVGLRIEHTNADGYTIKKDISNTWDHTTLFPSLSL